MLEVHLDFESRSYLSLPVTGAYKYSKHLSTSVNCMAYAIGDGEIKLWYRGDSFPEHLRTAIEAGALVWAHNAQFERNIWDNVQVKRLGWPEIPFENWRCSAAKCRHANHPGGLDAAVERLLPELGGKDETGGKILKTMYAPCRTPIHKCECLPRCTCDCRCNCVPICGCTTTSRKTGITAPRMTCKCKTVCKCKCGCLCRRQWVEDPVSMALLGEYCRKDVLIERALVEVLPEWPESEIEVWQLNERVNDRGVPLDSELCESAHRVLGKTLTELSTRISGMTAGVITTGNQIQRIKQFVNERGVNTDCLDADAVEALLETELPEDVRDVLQLRQITAGAAAKKFSAALEVGQVDNRGRGLFMYYGASATGRFAGMKLQPHNMKHGADTTGTFRRAVCSESMDVMKLLYEDTIITELGKNVRAMIRADEGCTLVRCDSSQIECRVLHWLAGNQHMLDTFRRGEDPYIKLAEKAFNKKVNKKDQERQVGKAAVLGLGFGMGATRFKAQVYEQSNPKITLTEKFAKHVVDVYRKDNAPVLKFWANLEAAAYACVTRKQSTRVGKLSFGMWGEYLIMRLPSGRRLFYYQPRFEGKGRNARFEFNSPRGVRHEWAGGLLCENAVQATARDTLVFYMKQAELRGLDVVFHVHDELAVMVKKERAEWAERTILECFAERLPWMGDLPCATEAKVWEHYCG